MTGGGKRKLFIGGLPSECDEKALGNAFSRWETEDVIVVYDRETRRSRNFGYVTFRDERDAADAMKQMGGESGKGKEVFQRALNIEYAQDKESARPARRGGGPPRGPPRGPPMRGPPPGRGPPFGRDMVAGRGPPPRGGGPPAPRRGPMIPERNGPYESYDRYERPPPERRPPPPDRTGYPPPREYERGGYERERERPPTYGSERGYGDKYPPPERGYSSSERGYGPPSGERYEGAARGYGSERTSYPERYTSGERYPPGERGYGGERGYDRSTYGGSERGYGATEPRSYGAPYERSSYGPPPERSPGGTARPGFASTGSYSAAGRNW